MTLMSRVAPLIQSSLQNLLCLVPEWLTRQHYPLGVAFPETTYISFRTQPQVLSLARTMNPDKLDYSIDSRDLRKVVTALCRAATHFNRNEMECLVKIFYSFMDKGYEQGTQNGLDRSEFRNVLHSIFGMTDDMLMNRVFVAFDKDNDNHISTNEWVEGLSVILRGTFEEKMKYCYRVYYLNGDGYISQDEMFDMLKNSLLKHPVEEDPDEGIKELVEITLRKMDYDNDGKLSFEDFEQAVKKDCLLLEVFGPCLPDTEKCLEFETLAFKDINSEFQM